MSTRSLCLAASLFATACTVLPDEEAGLDEIETAPSGVTGIVRGTASSASTEIEYTWEGLRYELKSSQTPDGRVYLTMQDVIFAPDGHTGWHTHAGPTVAMVTQGTLTIYRASAPCTGREFAAGQAFIDGPAMGNHIARNHTGGEVVVQLLHQLATPTTPFRVDQPAPPGADGCKGRY